MTKISERNHLGQYYVNTKIGIAKTRRADDFAEFGPDSSVYKLLTDLVEVNAKGFRGIVVTALTGMYLDENYDPLNNFYGCNPRSIFEGGIWYALQENNIPCGKSDPLNVAKNANRLNEDWAQGRRPQKAAIAAVNFLRLVTKSNKKEKEELIDYFFYRLWSHAQNIEKYQLIELGTANLSRQIIGHKIADFTRKYPESGHLPQHLIAQLLSGLFRTSTINVIGGDESVFGTNTTSKKPADIWLEIDGSQTNLYEITVKPISKKRLDDTLDALKSTGHLGHTVTFICRMDRDVNDLDVVDGSLIYKGKRFDFIDYRAFCLSLCALLNDEELSTVISNITAFVQDKNISMKTKIGWNETFGIKP